MKIPASRIAIPALPTAAAAAAALLALATFSPRPLYAASHRAPAPALTRDTALPIYTWAENAPAWDRRLHVSGYRMGCDTGDPEGCVRDAEAEVKQHGMGRIFLSMDEDPVHTPADALDLSRLSLSHPYLVEAGLDDFVDKYQNLFWHGFDPRPWLREVIRNVKTLNPKLAFGITLYEDEIDSQYARPPYLPSDLARQVEFVHLFLHYRTDAPKFSQYVNQARTLFPNAQIIAGLYAYDRIDYIPCSPAGKRPCSPAEEISLYEESARMAAQMLKEGKIAGIEFYPGFFGMESKWNGWEHQDYCAPARVPQCIDDTRQMRENTVAIFNSILGWN
jgi:hypothetical protein